MHITFPKHSYRVKTDEPKWFHEGLRLQLKKVKRIYKRQGNSRDFKQAKRSFRKDLYTAKMKFYDKYISDLQKTNPKQWHREIARLSKNGGQRETHQPLKVPEFEDLNNSEQANRLADRIEKITKDYSIIDVESHMSTYSGGTIISLTYQEVVSSIKSANIPRGLHPCDPPRQIIKRFAELFAAPLTIIYNRCIRTSVWPSAWKTELTTMIPKKKVLDSAKDLRPIAITPIFSKILESIIRVPLLKDIHESMHKEQYGGVKGLSPNHYLTGLIHDITSASQHGHLSVLLTFDFSSAFNSLNHDMVVKAAAKLGVRPVLLRLLTSYLSERFTVVNWNSASSSPRLSRGGSGQGTLLSVSLFLISVNELLNQLDTEITKFEGHASIRSRPRLFVDDLGIIVPFDYKTLETNSSDEKTFEDDGRIAAYLNVIERFSLSTGMKLNKTKTAAVVFDFARSKTKFEHGSLAFSDGEEISVVPVVKLLGFPIDDNLTFSSFVKQRRGAGMAALWGLKRLKANGVKEEHLKIAYETYVRSSTEYAMAAVFPSLRDGQRKALESVQRAATRTILGTGYGPDALSYEERLEKLSLVRLNERWSVQFKRFAESVEHDPRFKKYLIRKQPSHGMTTRSRDLYEEETASSNRHQRSPVNAIIRHLNRRARN